MVVAPISALLSFASQRAVSTEAGRRGEGEAPRRFCQPEPLPRRRELHSWGTLYRAR